MVHKKLSRHSGSAVTVTKDLGESNQSTIWYNSRYYRLNILWQDSSLKIRDLHLFNEAVPDKYLKDITTVNQSFFYTLPVVDGFQWGKPDQPEGFRLLIKEDGKEIYVKGEKPAFINTNNTSVHISWSTTIGMFEMDCKDSSFTIKNQSNPGAEWFLDLFVRDGAQTPVKSISAKSVLYNFDNHTYQLKALTGTIKKADNGSLYRIEPNKGKIQLYLADNNLK